MTGAGLFGVLVALWAAPVAFALALAAGVQVADRLGALEATSDPERA